MVAVAVGAGVGVSDGISVGDGEGAGVSLAIMVGEVVGGGRVAGMVGTGVGRLQAERNKPPVNNRIMVLLLILPPERDTGFATHESHFDCSHSFSLCYPPEVPAGA
jgi:hypothetical protein